MDKFENIKQKVGQKNKSSIFTFLVFLVISTAAWLMVKLSEEYTTQAVFRVQLSEVPADKWMSSPEQSVKMSLNVDGFHTLLYKMMGESKRVVVITLNDVPYRLENGNTYSFSSQYVSQKVAELLDVNPTDITINEAKVYFNMDALKSKVVPVSLRSDIKTQRQYGIYGIPMVDPASVTIFGPQEVIDTIKAVRTELVSKDNVNQNFSVTVPLDMLGGQIRSNVKVVKAEVEVEKFTELDVEVPIRVDSDQKIRFFPETMTVKCLVAMRDYASITPDSFDVTVDEEQLKDMRQLLDIQLITWPPSVQIVSTRPDKVEYLIVQ